MAIKRKKDNKPTTKLAVNGKDVMNVLGIRPGERVGEVLRKLTQEVEQDPQRNTKNYLLKRLKAYK